jgi:hypothetical protein
MITAAATQNTLRLLCIFPPAFMLLNSPSTAQMFNRSSGGLCFEAGPKRTDAAADKHAGDGGNDDVADVARTS